jgi:DNA-binding NtrC family response regulator
MDLDPLSVALAPDPVPPAVLRPPAAAGASVLILDAEPALRSLMQRALGRHFALVDAAANRSEAEDLLRRCRFDLLVADIGPSGTAGLAWVDALGAQGRGMDLILVAADADLQSAIAALRAGACDFIPKPFGIEQLLAAAQRAVPRRGLRREHLPVQREGERLKSLGGLVGDCPATREVCGIIQRIAPTPATVLIEGESGTGKELAARAIHARSGRPGGFVAIDCGAVSSDLLESELFGHVKGAFTGAHQAREGLFCYARGGSLFLDEIGEMPLLMQAKLLRVLEERTVRPVGGNELLPVDVRIIAATNRTLSADVGAGRFRKDLFYRLNVVALRLPPLRERRDDVVPLARYFLRRLSAELGLPAPGWDGWDLDQLRRYDWPGNVRELRNVVERCLLLGRRPGRCILEPEAEGPAARDGDPDLSLATVERAHILRVLEVAEGNKSDAARRLGISRKTLERKLKAWEEDAGPE